MIFPKEKILLMHPGKTGGTTLEDALCEKHLHVTYNSLSPTEFHENCLYGLDRETGIYAHHGDLRYISDRGIDISDFKGYTTCRRPYERILSAYYYNGWDKKEKNFNKFVHKELRRLRDRNNKTSINHFTKQVYYFRHDFTVLKLEEIENWHTKLGLKPLKKKLAKTKASKNHSDYLKAYNHDSRRIIEELYLEDFLVFGYEYEK